MAHCYNCNKEHDDITSTLCPECQKAHKNMNWGDLLKQFARRPEKSEQKNEESSATPTIDEILNKCGIAGRDSLTPVELGMLNAYRDKMMRLRGRL